MVASPSRCSSAGTNSTEARNRRAISAGSTELVSSEASTTSVRSASWNLHHGPDRLGELHGPPDVLDDRDVPQDSAALLGQQ